MAKVITYILGDNDFASSMGQAAEHLVYHYGAECVYNMEDQVFLNAMACLMVGFCTARKYVEGRCKKTDMPEFSLYEYFNTARVERNEHYDYDNQYDHNYSAVSISVYDNYIWMH